MPALNPNTGRLLAQRARQILIPLTASGRAWAGGGVYSGLRVTAQTTAGSGIKVYDGDANDKVLIHTIAAPVVGQAFYRPTGKRHALRNGLFVELLGTGQTVDVQVGG